MKSLTSFLNTTLNESVSNNILDFNKFAKSKGYEPQFGIYDELMRLGDNVNKIEQFVKDAIETRSDDIKYMAELYMVLLHLRYAALPKGECDFAYDMRNVIELIQDWEYHTLKAKDRRKFDELKAPTAEIQWLDEVNELPVCDVFGFKPNDEVYVKIYYVDNEGYATGKNVGTFQIPAKELMVGSDYIFSGKLKMRIDPKVTISDEYTNKLVKLTGNRDIRTGFTVKQLILPEHVKDETDDKRKKLDSLKRQIAQLEKELEG